MREVEFLRYLTDLIDSKINAKFQEQEKQPVVVHVHNGADGTDDNTINPDDIDSPIDRDDVFVPPLQAKIEMMKKMTGVEQKNQDLMSDDSEPFDH